MNITVTKNGVTNLKKAANLTGDYVKIFLKAGGIFNLKIMETQPDKLTGYDDERITITVAIDDIDYVEAI